MRLELGELNNKILKPVKDLFAYNSNSHKLDIVQDSIAPPASPKVEEALPVAPAPVSESTPSNATQQQAPERHTPQKDDAEHSNTAVTVSRADTVKHAAPRQPERTEPRQESSAVNVAPTPIARTTEIEEPVVVQSTPAPALAPSIPFPVVQDTIVAMDTINVIQTVESTVAREVDYSGQKKGKDLPVRLDRIDGIFALLLVCFLLLTHIYNGGISFFKDNIMLVFSSSKSDKLETQTTTKEIFYSYFLVFLAILLISIALYEGLDRYAPLTEGDKSPFITIGLFMVLMFLFIFLKLTFNKFIGYMFDFQKRMAVWNQSYTVLLSLFGLLCFFPILILVYSDLWDNFIIGFVLVLFLIVQIILFVRLIIFFIEQRFNFLYLIAYLCTVEFLPYVFLGIGLVYLYKIDIFNTLI